MSRLAIFIPFDRHIEDANAGIFACNFQDALKFAAHIGEPILIVRTAPFGSATAVALGTIGDVPVTGADDTAVRIEQVRLFPREVPLLETPPAATQITELAQYEFERIVDQAISFSDLQGSPALYPETSSPNLFITQLARQQQDKCSFSGVETENGMASIIRPLHFGGTWHVRNFLFLDEEPSELFGRFAWTVGPHLEILIDAHAMNSGAAEAVHHKGLLALSEKSEATIDRDALAWHRAQFFERLRG